MFRLEYTDERHYVLTGFEDEAPLGTLTTRERMTQGTLQAGDEQWTVSRGAGWVTAETADGRRLEIRQPSKLRFRWDLTLDGRSYTADRTRLWRNDWAVEDDGGTRVGLLALHPMPAGELGGDLRGAEKIFIAYAMFTRVVGPRDATSAVLGT